MPVVSIPAKWRTPLWGTQVLCLLLVLMGLTAPPAAAQPPKLQDSWRIDLAGPEADRGNVARRPDGITVRNSGVRTRSVPGTSAVYTSPGRSLGRQLTAFTVRTRAKVPKGTRVQTEVRGSNHPGTWTQWRTTGGTGAVRLPQAVSLLQVRLTLVGVPGGASPTVRSVTVAAAAVQPAPQQTPQGSRAAASGPTYRLFATREGLVGGTTANGHVIQPRDHFVALPSRRMLAVNGGREYQVRLCYKGRCETAPVWDVGPWNTRDDYWNPPAQREMWRDLAQGTPEAQAAYLNGYNGGLDEFGRRAANPAGIDVADGTFWDGLGMTDNDYVEVTFMPDGGGGGGSTTVTAWTEANVRACASTSCEIRSKVVAGETYPADCWVVGQSVTAEGVTNDKWVRLPLNAGGVGYVSGIFLKGNETGGVSRQC
ncbi:SH3 domain-containing protein [Streptomyces sp. NBC_01451]|uniref:SH3 domain-containing protein n=1 Tax=Streptomyces sp. NBC_01451 TaxID=2903872 RepID=UPI002E353BBF|nr:SH3 domain-containing protein [Streptomyces sp. NBC_01451]